MLVLTDLGRERLFWFLAVLRRLDIIDSRTVFDTVVGENALGCTIIDAEGDSYYAEESIYGKSKQVRNETDLSDPN